MHLLVDTLDSLLLLNILDLLLSFLIRKVGALNKVIFYLLVSHESLSHLTVELLVVFKELQTILILLTLTGQVC
jgi:hypothetical protein